MPQVQEEAVEDVLPEGVNDYDLEMKDDPTAVANYAYEIFKYYQEREVSASGEEHSRTVCLAHEESNLSSSSYHESK